MKRIDLSPYSSERDPSGRSTGVIPCSIHTTNGAAPISTPQETTMPADSLTGKAVAFEHYDSILSGY
jgi:hypothetical protein